VLGEEDELRRILGAADLRKSSDRWRNASWLCSSQRVSVERSEIKRRGFCKQPPSRRRANGWARIKQGSLPLGCGNSRVNLAQALKRRRANRGERIARGG